MIDTSLLAGIGVSEKAAKVYLAALGLGTASVQALSEKAGLKRPTTYLHLQELLDAGLLEKAPVGKKDYYRAANPDILAEQAENRLAQIKQAMPELRELQSATSGQPGVRVLVGKQGAEQVYREIAQANNIRFWTELAVFEDAFKKMFEHLSESIQENQIRTREIIADTPQARRASKRYAAVAGKHYSSRVATQEGIQNDSAIYGNVVALFRIHEMNLYVVRIEDVTIASTMRALFDMAWDSAKPFIN
jgi:sugar-specific transcriptional regulator TrmB